MTPNTRNLLIKATLSAFMIQTLLGYYLQCRTVYGGTCILQQDSSSFGAAASVLILSMSIMLISSRDIVLKILAILSSTFFFALGIQQGSRLFWALLITSFCVICFDRFIRSACKLTLTVRIKTLKRFLLLLIALPPIIFTIVRIVNFNSIISFSRFAGFLTTISDDARLSSGIMFGSRLTTDTSDITSLLFGHSLFSQMTTWNATSSYDSTINLLLSDFGLIGTSFLFLFLVFALIFQLKTLQSLQKSYTPLTLALSLYLVGSLTNEFLFLKSFNPLFVFLVALVSSSIDSTKQISPAIYNKDPFANNV